MVILKIKQEMEIEKFKTFEGAHKGMDVNGIIDMLDTLQKMSEVAEMLKETKPKKIRKHILGFLKINEGKLDDTTEDRIKYIAQIWNDAFEGTEILFTLKRRIDPLIEKLKKME
jgi:hypoxanthine-guanine phosphoribosyltransferase